jgi:hypothetical protein
MTIARLGEKMAGFPLVQTGMAAPPQFRVFQPIEREQRPLDAADFGQREVNPVLAAVGREPYPNWISSGFPRTEKWLIFFSTAARTINLPQ